MVRKFELTTSSIVKVISILRVDILRDKGSNRVIHDLSYKLTDSLLFELRNSLNLVQMELQNDDIIVLETYLEKELELLQNDKNTDEAARDNINKLSEVIKILKGAVVSG